MAKILVVDDSETLRLELVDVLRSHHEVVEGSDGFDGLQKAEEQQNVDLIISDYNMPGMDGITMIRKIKAIDRYKNVPVAMLTTESSKELKLAGKEAGVVVWMIKPFDGDKMKATVQKILETFK